jgi:hypothetical protein
MDENKHTVNISSDECCISFQLNLDKVWTVIFGVPASKPVSIAAKEKQTDLCPEAAIVILSMIRSMLNQVSQTQQKVLNNGLQIHVCFIGLFSLTNLTCVCTV